MDHSGHAVAVRRRKLSLWLSMVACMGLGGLLLFAALSIFVTAIALRHAIGIVMAEGVTVELLSASFLALCSLYLGIRCMSCLYQPPALPQGVLLHQHVAPSLHALIARVGKHFGHFPISAVLMTGGMNAAVVQRPRWGLIGPMQTYLLLGVPLTHSVSDRLLAGILAHEFAHLTRQRRGLDAWACHLRAWWFRVLDCTVECLPDRAGRWLDQASASSLQQALRLARLEEIEADDVAARVAGRRLIAEVLVEVAIKERFLADDYWPKVMGQCARMPRPSIRPYREMALGMTAGFRRVSSCVSLEKGLDAVGGSQTDGLCDFHLPLPERLLRLGVTAVNLPGGEPSVAEKHLVAILPSLSHALDRNWWACTRRQWRKHYRSSRQLAVG